MNRSAAATLVASFVLSSCTQEASQGRTPVGEAYATQVALGECIFVPKADQDKIFGPVVAAIAASAISQGVNYLGSALTEAGNSKEWQAFSSRNFESSKDSFPRCIQIARGRFYTNPSSPDAMLKASWATDTSAVPRGEWNRDAYRQAIANGLWLAAAPDFFFEGVFRGSADRQALTVEPVVATLAEPIGRRLFRFDDDRQIAIFAALHAPGTDLTLKTKPAISLALGSVGPKQPRIYRTTTDHWDGDDPPRSVPYEAAWFALSKTDAEKPLTASVLVTETEGASEFYAFLGRILSDSATQTATTQALQNLIIPESRAAAEQSERQQEVTAANDADAELADAISKLRACSAAEENIESAGADAIASMRNANLKAAIAGRRDPFSRANIAEIDLRAGPARIVDACQRILVAVLDTT